MIEEAAGMIGRLSQRGLGNVQVPLSVLCVTEYRMILGSAGVEPRSEQRGCCGTGDGFGFIQEPECLMWVRTPPTGCYR